MRKKLLIIPIIVLILAAITCVSFAAWIKVDADLSMNIDSGEWSPNNGNFKFADYTVGGEKVGYKIIGFVEEMKGTTLTIPSENEGLPVMAIAASFTAQAKNDLIKITIPSSVEVIEADAFSDMVVLSNVVFAGTGLVEIGARAFQRCQYIATITFPSTITNIGEDVLASCPRLTDININNLAKNVNNGLPPISLGKKADGTFPTITYAR